MCGSRDSAKAKQLYIRSTEVKMFKVMRKKENLCKFNNSLIKYFIFCFNIIYNPHIISEF